MTPTLTHGAAVKAATELPAPSSRHATCAWCRRSFPTITDLIDHVDANHADTSTAPAAA